MSFSTVWIESNTGLEAVYAQLPASNAMKCSKGQTIYSPEHPSARIYLVVSGMVELSQIAGDSPGMLVDIIPSGELFGESAFLDVPCLSERAIALESTGLESWAISDIECLLMDRPSVAKVLLQVIAKRSVEAILRIESLSSENVERRVARALVHFSERLGTREKDGSWKMAPISHFLIARYAGTSREVATRYMNRLRRRGYISYSRKGISLHQDPLNALSRAAELASTEKGYCHASYSDPHGAWIADGEKSACTSQK